MVGRPAQQLPKGDWLYWLILAGRGFGKTRTGAEIVLMWAECGAFPRISMIGATHRDAMLVMLEGESGLLNLCNRLPEHKRPIYKAQKQQLHFPNGCIVSLFSADEPERLRGTQSNKIWADELAAWRYPEAWDMALFGNRLPPANLKPKQIADIRARGISLVPQAIITTTPKPTPIVKDLHRDAGTVLTTGSTFDNKANLQESFLKQVRSKYEGTRLGRQELYAAILDDNPGALWNRALLDSLRVSSLTLTGDPARNIKPLSFRRVLVGVDPAVSYSEESDETGIVAVGLGEDGFGYVLEDASMRGTPDEWAKRVSEVAKRWFADAVVAEVNQGGELVAGTLRTADPNLAVIQVRAAKGKFARAEPVSALYEQRRVKHVGSFAKLEDQLCEYDQLTAKRSPDRMDALVWALTKLMIENNGTGLLDHNANEAAKLAALDPRVAATLEAKRKQLDAIFNRTRQ